MGAGALRSSGAPSHINGHEVAGSAEHRRRQMLPHVRQSTLLLWSAQRINRAERGGRSWLLFGRGWWWLRRLPHAGESEMCAQWCLDGVESARHDAAGAATTP